MKNKILYILALLPLVFTYCSTESPSSMSALDKNLSLTGISGLVTGKGGSMARFSLADNALYVLTENQLMSYDISTPTSPKLQSNVDLGWGQETVFTYDSLLFIGSQSGMSVYDRSNPFDLEYMSYYQHMTACDPVVFDGKYAYVTLNSQHEVCGRYMNELQVVNMSEIEYPYLERSYELTSPKGLGVDGNMLFVCDANSLVVYDKTNPLELEEIADFELNGVYDVIPYNNNLIVTSAGGIFQFAYNLNNNTIDLQSSIIVEKE